MRDSEQLRSPLHRRATQQNVAMVPATSCSKKRPVAERHIPWQSIILPKELCLIHFGDIFHNIRDSISCAVDR